MHSVDAAGDPTRARQRHGPRTAVAQGAEKIIDRFAREQRGVRADLTGGQMRVAASENGEPVLAGRAFDRRGAVAAEGKSRLDRVR